MYRKLVIVIIINLNNYFKISLNICMHKKLFAFLIHKLNMIWTDIGTKYMLDILARYLKCNNSTTVLHTAQYYSTYLMLTSHKVSQKWPKGQCAGLVSQNTWFDSWPALLNIYLCVEHIQDKSERLKVLQLKGQHVEEEEEIRKKKIV